MTLGRVFLVGLLGLAFGLGACEREPQTTTLKSESTLSPKPPEELLVKAVKASLEHSARNMSNLEWRREFLSARDTSKGFRFRFEPLLLTAADRANGLLEPCWLVYINYTAQYAPEAEWSDGYMSVEAIRTREGVWLIRTPDDQYVNGSWESRY